MKAGVHVPRSLLLQWHVTERCNLRCAHCYQEGALSAELAFTELRAIDHKSVYWKKIGLFYRFLYKY